MKHLLSLSILFFACPFTGSVLAATSKSTQPKRVEESVSKKESNKPQKQDPDEKIVLETFATMLNCFGNITSDPHNPAVVGVNATAMMAGFVNVLLHIFRNTPMRNHKPLIEFIERYFEDLSKEEYAEIVSCIMGKAFEMNQLMGENAPRAMKA